MRDEKRIEKIMKELTRLWKKVPDWRLGQFLINLGIVPDNTLLFYTEDDVIEKWLKKQDVIK